MCGELKKSYLFNGILNGTVVLELNVSSGTHIVLEKILISIPTRCYVHRDSRLYKGETSE